MAALPYIQLYVADYLADTSHLSVTASGAYLHLIMNYWQTGKPLKNCDERLAMIARCFNGEWKEVKETVLEFFEERDGLLFHKRIEADLAKVIARGATDPELNGEWKGYVYFITPETKEKVKIGYSKNPWARIKDLQISSSEKLLLVATVKTTASTEKKLHKELDEYLISGEWFVMSPLIFDLIMAIKDKKVTTVDESINYCSNYGNTTVVTTKYTDTDTDTDTDIKESLSLAREECLKKFEVAWQKYPATSKGSETKAQEKFLKLTKDDPLLADKILKAIEDQHAERILKQRYGHWCPEWKHFVSWLHNSYWKNKTNLNEEFWRNEKNQRHVNASNATTRPKSKTEIMWEVCAPGAFEGTSLESKYKRKDN